MSRASAKMLFAIVFVVLFLGAIELINGWRMELATFASMPIILSAETIVLGMLYMTIFHDLEQDDSVEAEDAAKIRGEARKSHMSPVQRHTA